MGMRTAGATHAAGTGSSSAGGRLAFAAAAGGSKYRKLFGKFGRTAARTFSALPLSGTDEDFAIALALFTMKFVNRHEGRIRERAKSSSVKGVGCEGSWRA